MEIKTLIELSPAELLPVFNGAFAQYFVPIQLSLEQLIFKLKVDDVALEYSVGAFDKGQLVGFILHGIDIHQGQITAYNAGTGVLKAYRGQQITKQLYQYILPVLKAIGVNYSILEVIKENIPARKIYQQVGFEELRGLNCYQQTTPLLDTAPNRVQQRIGTKLWLLPSYHNDKTPTWQNSFHSIEHYQEQVMQFLVEEQGQLAASLIVYKKTGRILHLHVAAAHRRKGIGKLLLGRAAQFFAGLSIINVDEQRADLNAFLLALGFKNTLQQYEMGMLL